MINKKGLSDLVATVLIVLLALAAVAIIWGFLKPAFDRTGKQIDLQSQCFTAEIQPISCTFRNDTSALTNANVTIRVQRKGGEFQFVRAVLNGPDGVSVKSEEIAAPGNLGTAVFNWNSAGTEVDVTRYSPTAASFPTLFTEVSVAAVISDGTNKQTCVETKIPCVYTP